LRATATIVLPVHNRERTLCPEVLRILDLAEILHRRVVVAIVDDGSHDGTYEAASELARQFPQVRVLRQPYQRGLGGALELVQSRLGAARVVAHNGVAAIDLDELAELLTAPDELPSAVMVITRETATEASGSRRFAAPMLSNSGQSVAPSSPAARAGSFRWLRLDEPIKPRRSRAIQPAVVELNGPISGGGGRTTTFTSRASFAK
jgi:GT2 family glycosyltransferase